MKDIHNYTHSIIIRTFNAFCCNFLQVLSVHIFLRILFYSAFGRVLCTCIAPKTAALICYFPHICCAVRLAIAMYELWNAHHNFICTALGFYAILNEW